MMPNTLIYRIFQIFWSIYFAVTLGVIGLIFGYIPAFAIYFLAWLFTPWSWAANKIRYFGEYLQCFSIRLLLMLQPWLKCETNLHGIYGFYDRFQTRKIVFVANHRSNLDTFLLISYIPGLRGLAKSSLFYNLLFAPYMHMAGFIPVEKGSSQSFLLGLRRLGTELLARSQAVLFFPETTRCEKGFPSVHKFTASVFSVAIEAKALIVPLAIQSTDQLMGRGDLLIHPFHPVKIEMLEPIEASRFQDSLALRDLVWQQLKAHIA